MNVSMQCNESQIGALLLRDTDGHLRIPESDIDHVQRKYKTRGHNRTGFRVTYEFLGCSD